MQSTTINNITFGAKIRSVPSISRIAGQRTVLPNLNLNGYNALIGCDVFTPTCRILKHDLLFKDGKLIAIDDFNEYEVESKINYTFLDGKTVAPAIFDEHIHGGYGISFHDSDETEIRSLLKLLAQNGTGAVIATMLPGSAEHIRNQIQVLNNIIKNPDKDAAKIYGIHLEGPFLNRDKKGIHSIRDLMFPTIENYESFNPENIKIVTLAPELDDGYKLTKYLQKLGVVVSAGHSMASADDLIQSGIRQVTHIFNAMAPLHHRIPTIANEGLNNPKVTAELLADENSVIPSVMNMIMKLKPKEKIVLISDALPNAGLKGDFVMNNKVIHVGEDMVPRDADGTLAGNMRFLYDAAKILIGKTCMTFRDFIRYASVNPARNMGAANDFTIKEGATPSFSVWDNKELIPEKTFIA